MKMLYKYSQVEFPYQDLQTENRRRGFYDFEYELLDMVSARFPNITRTIPTPST